MKQKRWLFLVMAVVVVIVSLWSVLLLTASTHKTLDQRVNEVGAQLKCPICQGESVADLPSLLAQQMRDVIRTQLQEGKSEQEVIQYFEDHYGELIVWSPPWQGFTLLAWLVPIALVSGGAVLLFFTLRDWSTFAPASATGLGGVSEDDRKLARIDEAELERYRLQLEQELAADDPLFVRNRTEVG